MFANKILAISVVVSATSLWPVAARAADPTPAGAGAAQAPKSDDDQSRRVCREVTPTGSRFIKRECKTAAEWNKISENAQNEVDRERRGNADLDRPPQ